MSNPTGLPYTPAVAAGGWVVVSGQLGLLDGALVEDFAGEVDQAIANLAARLAEHGLGLEHVVKTTCFLADLDQFATFNERYAAAFPEPRPARSAFQVARLPFDGNVEIEAWALQPAG
ncbi:deaminase [Aquihabitans sp. G128]|uniref:RidA family protein n=1 Tax=Aquihabitans sp. G128 TaxID=2849779 RepID=UPI001C22A481|nr:Rid family hydrolase [Aquihabitans sp. G128]QXC60082.1 deaminase [Aquihabitans sp. G128]